MMFELIFNFLKFDCEKEAGLDVDLLQDVQGLTEASPDPSLSFELKLKKIEN